MCGRLEFQSAVAFRGTALIATDSSRNADHGSIPGWLSRSDGDGYCAAMDMGMRRRDFLGILGAAAWPHVALAQQDGSRRVPIVGFVGFATPGIDDATLQPFRKALADLGYVEGRSIIVDARSAHGDAARGHAMIDEFVAKPVDVLLSPGPAAARAMVRKTKIPVVAIALPAV